MEMVMVIMFFTGIITAYFLWFTFIARALRGPRVWPIVGSFPGLIENNRRLHDWIAESLCTCGGTYQTCIRAIPFLSRKQALVTVTCDPCNMEHVLKTRFGNYPKCPTWQAVFHDLLGQGIFNSWRAVLLRHRLTLVPGHRVEQKISVTLFMRYGLKVNVHPRDLGAIVATHTPATSGVINNGRPNII